MTIAAASSHDGLLSDVILLLHSMPRTVLLILKTSDLTHSTLTNKLDSPLGPERTFLIMASYYAKTVHEEQREQIISKYRKWGITRWIELVGNWR